MNTVQAEAESARRLSFASLNSSFKLRPQAGAADPANRRAFEMLTQSELQSTSLLSCLR
jgi:hypothetical protein